MADKPTEQQIAREATLRARLTESQVERLVALLQTFLERAMARQERALGSDVSAAQAAAALADLERIVREGGLPDILGGVRDLFAQELGLTLEDFQQTTGREVRLSGFAEQNLNTLVDDRLRMAARMVDRYLGDVRTAVLDTVILGNPPDLRAAAEDAGPRVLADLKTELNTALLSYQRVAHFEAAEAAGITRFLYVGPLDRITRAFCRRHLGKVYTRGEVARLDNGQGLPVEVYAGGYNCRHHWRPVSDELARELTGGE